MNKHIHDVPVFVERAELKTSLEEQQNYPPALFQDLPYDWMVYEDVDVASETYKRFTALGCVYWHPPRECDDDIVNFDKRVIVANLEEWLDNRAPDAYRALLTLYGCG